MTVPPFLFFPRLFFYGFPILGFAIQVGGQAGETSEDLGSLLAAHIRRVKRLLNLTSRGIFLTNQSIIFNLKIQNKSII
jgi:hypothetical protein